MKTQKELLGLSTAELIQIILDLQKLVLDLKEENRRLKDEIAATKKSRLGRK